MRLPTVHRRRLAWLACFAILLNTLAAPVSQALASWRGDTTIWLELCTQTGLRNVAFAADALDGDGTPAPAVKSAPCPFCLPNPGWFVALPPVFALPQAGSLAQAAPDAPRESPAPPARRHRTAQPRAPPAVS